MNQARRALAAILVAAAMTAVGCSSGDDDAKGSDANGSDGTGSDGTGSDGTGGSDDNGNGGSGSNSTTTTTEASVEDLYPRDDELRLNEIQLIGTHNSYHKRPNPEFQVQMEEMLPVLKGVFDYEHRPLTEQLGELGIRQFELDVFHDPEGTIFSDRKAHAVAGLPPDGGIEELHDPGFKVLHVQEVDVESTCPSLVVCMTEIEEWSDANPWHVPVFVLIEMKADVTPDVFEMGFVPPLPIDADAMAALDAEIESVFSPDDLITPDMVRGSAATLEEAVTTEGWPTLGEVRGRVMFMLDNGGEVQDTYLTLHPNLEGALLFTGDHAAGDAEAGFMKLNDPFDSDLITESVQSGYVVRTRSDGDAHIGSTDPTEQRDVALGTGAQFVSTDYPEPTLATFPEYIVRFDHSPPDVSQEDIDSGAANPFARCNPVIGPDWCTALDVERRPSS